MNYHAIGQDQCPYHPIFTTVFCYFLHNAVPVVTRSQKKTKHHPYQTRQRPPRATAAPRQPVSTPQPKHAQPLKYAPWWTDQSKVMSQRLASQAVATRSTQSTEPKFTTSKKRISWCTANYYAPLAQLNNKIAVHDSPPQPYHLNRQSPTSGKRKQQKPLQTGMSTYEKQICSRMKSALAADETMRSVKIRVCPDATQKAALKQIFGNVRVVWNQGLEEIYVLGHPKNWQSLRNKIVTACNVTAEEKSDRPWLYDGNICSSKIKEETIHKLVSSIKATEESLRAQNKEFKYQMSRKKKKDSRQSFSFYPGGAYALRCVESTCTVKNGTKRKNFGLKLPFDSLASPLRVISESEFQRAKSIIEQDIEKKGSDEYKRLIEVVWEKPDHFYVCFPYNKTNQEKTTEDHPTAAALDPGVRTFQTVYDSSGNFFEAGKGDIRRVERLCLHLDRLISKASGVRTGRKNRYKRRRMNAGIQRARQRIKNLISDFHGKLAHDLTSRYNIILIPTFDVSKMAIKSNRKINSKTARNMLNWSHYKFKQRLLQKSEENPNCNVHVVTKEYTSKACGICGRLNHKLGGNKKFNCIHCGFKFDRDMNAALNIMIKNLESSRYKLVSLSGLVATPSRKTAESVLPVVSG